MHTHNRAIVHVETARNPVSSLSFSNPSTVLVALGVELPTLLEMVLVQKFKYKCNIDVNLIYRPMMALHTSVGKHS
jgi:hypothetical protein